MRNRHTMIDRNKVAGKLTTIRSVESPGDLRSFLRLPWAIYKDDPHWVPPLLREQLKVLDRDRNPFFRHCRYGAWIALVNGKPAGRILAFVDDAYNAFHHERTGFIGFFECQDDQDASGALFDAAGQWLRNQGMNRMVGPVNFSMGNECGVQLDAFDTAPYIQMGHGRPYYPALFETERFRKEHDLFAFRLDMEGLRANPAFIRLEQIAERIIRRDQVSFRAINVKRYDDDLRIIYELFESTFRDNWGFVPSSFEEVRHAADSLRQIMEPRFVLFAEIGGVAVGYTVCLPDFNQVLKRMNGRLWPFGWLKYVIHRKRIDRGRMYMLGIANEYRRRGLDAVLYCMSLRRGLELGYREAELSTISEQNQDTIRIVENLGAERYKTYRIYARPLD